MSFLVLLIAVPFVSLCLFLFIRCELFFLVNIPFVVWNYGYGMYFIFMFIGTLSEGYPVNWQHVLVPLTSIGIVVIYMKMYSLWRAEDWSLFKSLYFLCSEVAMFFALLIGCTLHVEYVTDLLWQIRIFAFLGALSVPLAVFWAKASFFELSFAAPSPPSNAAPEQSTDAQSPTPSLPNCGTQEGVDPSKSSRVSFLGIGLTIGHAMLVVFYLYLLIWAVVVLRPFERYHGELENTIVFVIAVLAGGSLLLMLSASSGISLKWKLAVLFLVFSVLCGAFFTARSVALEERDASIRILDQIERGELLSACEMEEAKKVILNEYLAHARYVDEFEHCSLLDKEERKQIQEGICRNDLRGSWCGAQMLEWLVRLPFTKPFGSRHNGQGRALYAQLWDADIEEDQMATLQYSAASKWGWIFRPRPADRVRLKKQDVQYELTLSDYPSLDSPDSSSFSSPVVWADVEIHEEYQHDYFRSGTEIEYVFALPPESAITGLWLGSSGVEGSEGYKEFPHRVSPRGAAESVYERQKVRMVDPALLEQVGPFQYRLRVFPIPPSRNLLYRLSSLFMSLIGMRFPNLGRRSYFSSDYFDVVTDSLAEFFTPDPQQHLWMKYRTLVHLDNPKSPSSSFSSSSSLPLHEWDKQVSQLVFINRLGKHLDASIPLPRLLKSSVVYWDENTQRSVNSLMKPKPYQPYNFEPSEWVSRTSSPLVLWVAQSLPRSPAQLSRAAQTFPFGPASQRVLYHPDTVGTCLEQTYKNWQGQEETLSTMAYLVPAQLLYQPPEATTEEDNKKTEEVHHPIVVLVDRSYSMKRNVRPEVLLENLIDLVYEKVRAPPTCNPESASRFQYRLRQYHPASFVFFTWNGQFTQRMMYFDELAELFDFFPQRSYSADERMEVKPSKREVLDDCLRFHGQQSLAEIFAQLRRLKMTFAIPSSHNNTKEEAVLLLTDGGVFPIPDPELREFWPADDPNLPPLWLIHLSDLPQGYPSVNFDQLRQSGGGLGRSVRGVLPLLTLRGRGRRGPLPDEFRPSHFLPLSAVSGRVWVLGPSVLGRPCQSLCLPLPLASPPVDLGGEGGGPFAPPPVCLAGLAPLAAHEWLAQSGTKNGGRVDPKPPPQPTEEGETNETAGPSAGEVEGERLARLHGLAKTHSVASPLSSFLVLVEERQFRQLEEAEGEEGRRFAMADSEGVPSAAGGSSGRAGGSPPWALQGALLVGLCALRAAPRKKNNKNEE